MIYIVKRNLNDTSTRVPEILIVSSRAHKGKILDGTLRIYIINQVLINKNWDLDPKKL